jgi:hypothetical protein
MIVSIDVCVSVKPLTAGFQLLYEQFITHMLTKQYYY